MKSASQTPHSPELPHREETPQGKRVRELKAIPAEVS